MKLPEPLLYGKIPSLVVDEARSFARKTLTEHEHCIEIEDMRYSVVHKLRNSYEILIRLFHAQGNRSCTHTMTYSLGSDQADAQVSDNPEPLERSTNIAGD